jgi:hypothetical protein
MCCCRVSLDLVIVALYWGAIYGGSQINTLYYYRDFNQHVVTCVLLWLDLAISSMRLPDRHVLMPFAAGVIYIFWNLGYTKTIKPVYSILTWDNAYSVVLAIAALIGLVIFFFVASSAAFLRDSCYKKLEERAKPRVLHNESAVSNKVLGGAEGVTDRHYFDDGDAPYVPCSSCCRRTHQHQQALSQTNIAPNMVVVYGSAQSGSTVMIPQPSFDTHSGPAIAAV